MSEFRLPELDGLALQQELRASGAPAAIVFVAAARVDVRTTVRAMKQGAIDFLEKPVASGPLLSAVGAALARVRAEAERRRRLERLRARHERLTPREREVFALVTAGLLNKEVGWELGTSEKTVKVQRARAIEKMGARSFAELVRMADALGVRPPAPAGVPPGAAVAGAAAPASWSGAIG